MAAILHLRIKRDPALAIIEELPRNDAVELVPDEKVFEVPQWKIDQMRQSKKYDQQYPDELISWAEAWEMIKTY